MRYAASILSVAFCLIIFFAPTKKTYAQVIDARYESIFIYQFTKYIEWPPGTEQEDFIIGVIGKGDIITELNKLAETKTVEGKSIKIRPIKEFSQAYNCDMLFIANSQSHQIKEAVAALKQKSVLIISESTGGAQQGATINFILIDNRIKFEINRNSANNSNLKIRSSLLKLARIIG